MQLNCNAEGINPLPALARIGLVGNQENDCVSPDSVLGFGINFLGVNNVQPQTVVGNMASCCAGNCQNNCQGADNGAGTVSMFGYILAAGPSPPPSPPPPAQPPSPPPLPPVAFATPGLLVRRFNASVQSALQSAPDGGAALVRSLAAAAPSSPTPLAFGETALFHQPHPTANGLFLTPLLTLAVFDSSPGASAAAAGAMASTAQGGAMGAPLPASFCGLSSPTAAAVVLAGSVGRQSGIRSVLGSGLYTPMAPALTALLQARIRGSAFVRTALLQAALQAVPPVPSVCRLQPRTP